MSTTVASPLTIRDVASRLAVGQRIEIERRDDGRLAVATSGPDFPRENQTVIDAPIDREEPEAIDAAVRIALGFPADQGAADPHPDAEPPKVHHG